MERFALILGLIFYVLIEVFGCVLHMARQSITAMVAGAVISGRVNGTPVEWGPLLLILFALSDMLFLLVRGITHPWICHFNKMGTKFTAASDSPWHSVADLLLLLWGGWFVWNVITYSASPSFDYLFWWGVAQVALALMTLILRFSAGLCTKLPARIGCGNEVCPSPDMSTCCAVPSPAPGPFPSTRPRLRRRRFADLLREAATLRSTSSRGRANPRMVKRRNSPYASHDPTKLPGTRPDCSPALLRPQLLSAKQHLRFYAKRTVFGQV